MAWIRLTDNYDEDEQIQNLSDGSFRLWHQGLAWCRRNSTDGLIPFVTMRTFTAFTKGREKQLASVHRDGLVPLWVLVPGMGYRIKSYLKWNPNRETEEQSRREARERMQGLRVERRMQEDRRSHDVRANTENVHANTFTPLSRSSGEERRGSLDLQEKEDAIRERAGRLREELYPQWYSQYRHGARLSLFANSLEFSQAEDICRTWDDERIRKIAHIFLTTDDDWIARTDRSFKIFALKASWCDSRLAEWEKAQQAS